MTYDPARRLREPRLLKPTEVGAILKKHPDTLRKWRDKGEGPAFVMIGRRYMYTPRAVQDYINEQAQASR